MEAIWPSLKPEESTILGIFSIHNVKDHTGVAGIASCTTNCHYGSSATNIINNTHNGTCNNCHTNITNDGTLISATDGNASNGAGNCAFCHNAYATIASPGCDMPAL